MTFGHAWILVLIPVYIVFELLYYYTIRTKAAPLPAAGFVPMHSTPRIKAVRILRFLPPIAALLILLAISSPQSIQTEEQVLPSGINIMIVLDSSGSMAAEDLKPNRLEDAKDVIRDFVRGRPSDRIGLVIFSGKSVTRSPLTLQHDMLDRTIQDVKMGDLPEGTSIGMAIMSGINRLSATGENQGKKGDRIMILITDGRNNGEIHPLDAVVLAIQNKIKIYTIGVGGFEPAPYPSLTPEGKKTYHFEKADLDEGLLKTIAARTGGAYFRATDPESLSLLFRQIDRLEKSDPQILELTSIHSLTHTLAMPVLLVMICYLLLTISIVRLP